MSLMITGAINSPSIYVHLLKIHHVGQIQVNSTPESIEFIALSSERTKLGLSYLHKETSHTCTLYVELLLD